MTKSQDILFSIIIPTYNRAGMIGKAIESVLVQTYPNWELIIINDGSTDNTAQIINYYQDDRIKYFYQKNRGRSTARNLGIKMSKGEYISFLDDDDYYLPEFLEGFYLFIVKKQITRGIICCNTYEENENKKIKIQRRFHNNNYIETYWAHNDSHTNSFIIDKITVQKHKFPEKYFMWEDKYFILLILFESDFYYLDKYLVVYTDHKNRSVRVPYGKEYKKNAINRYEALMDFDKKYRSKMLICISKCEYIKGINKYLYWFASDAMKNYDFHFSILMINKIIFYNFCWHNLYFYMSILGRMPYYFIKKLFLK